MTASPHAALIERLKALAEEMQAAADHPSSPAMFGAFRLVISSTALALRDAIAALAAPAPQVTRYPCHCGIGEADLLDWVDSGLTLTCRMCGVKTVVSLQADPASQDETLAPKYSGAASVPFWDAVSRHRAHLMYDLGCALQNLEQRVLGCLKTGAIPVAPAPPLSEQVDRLHAQIINIQADEVYTDSVSRSIYARGHRDARHAAAELVVQSLYRPPDAPGV